MKIFAKLFVKKVLTEPMAELPPCSGNVPQLGEYVFFHIMTSLGTRIMTIGKVQEINSNSYTVNDTTILFEDIFFHEVLSSREISPEKTIS